MSDPEIRTRYLDLLERSLTHTLYAGADAVGYPPRSRIRRLLLRLLRRRGLVPVRILPEQERLQREGRTWPLFAHTMIGVERLNSLRRCVETVLADGVPGDLIEAGVWRGGASILMRGVLEANGVTDRTVWVADSFRGLPEPSSAYPADRGADWHTADYLAVSLDEVKANFVRYGLLDDQVRFVEGWFRDTLPALTAESWAVVRLDGDMYESTMDALVNLYPRLAPGGFLIVDDYAIPSCRQAVDDFRQSEAIEEPLETVDWTGVYWRRGTAASNPASGATNTSDVS